MKRAARLQAARHWLTTFRGQRVVRSYARWFGVDLECALKELQLLGVELDPRAVEGLRMTLASRSRPRGAPSAPEVVAQKDYDDDFAFVAGFTAAGFPFGTTWDELDPGSRGTLDEQRGVFDGSEDESSSSGRGSD